MRNLRAIAMISLSLYSVFVAATNGLAAHARWNRDSQTSDSVSKWEKRVKPVLVHIPSNSAITSFTGIPQLMATP